MRTFKIVNDDLVLDGQNNIAMVSGIEEAAQSIERTLTTNLSEWFLNILHGLDYNSIQGKNKDKEGIKLALTEAIHQEERVDEVEYMSVDIDNISRHLMVDFKVRLINGDMLEGKEVMVI